MREDEFAKGGVQGEAVDAPSRRQHKHDAGPVQRIAAADELASLFQKVPFACLPMRGVAGVDAKDGADADIGVDVGGTIQRVKDHSVAATVLVAHDGLLVLLRAHDVHLQGKAKSGCEGRWKGGRG